MEHQPRVVLRLDVDRPRVGRLRLSGFPGWVLWLTVHLMNIVTFRARLVTLLNWAYDYFFYDRPVRIMVTAETPPPEGP